MVEDVFETYDDIIEAACDAWQRLMAQPERGISPFESSSGSSVRRRNSTMIASSAGVSTVLLGLRGPMGASAVVVRDLHFVTVVRLRPYWRARLPVVSFDAWSSDRTRGVVRALP